MAYGMFSVSDVYYYVTVFVLKDKNSRVFNNFEVVFPNVTVKSSIYNKIIMELI